MCPDFGYSLWFLLHLFTWHLLRLIIRPLLPLLSLPLPWNSIFIPIPPSSLAPCHPFQRFPLQNPLTLNMDPYPPDTHFNPGYVPKPLIPWALDWTPPIPLEPPRGRPSSLSKAKLQAGEEITSGRQHTISQVLRALNTLDASHR